jgi:hypothetical protein
MFNRSVAGFFSYLLLFLIQGILYGNRALAQIPQNMDASVNVFGQSTGSTSGNGVSDSPNESMGGLASFRQSFKPWLGYEVNYSYTRFSERYSNLPYTVQNNLHEATGAYLAQAPKVFVLQPFVAAGGGWLVYLPTATGGQRYNQQFRPAFLYEAGVNYAVNRYFGLRVEYRGLVNTTPNFNQPDLTTGAKRQTSELAAGFYIHF